MPDERKPVICPWCGWEMVAREGQDIFHGKYNSYVCEGCEAVSPIAYSEDAAYAAATRTPPNRPLTREQVMALDDLDAVWVSDRACYQNVLPAVYIKERPIMYAAGKNVLFAQRPTPADIEAARAEKIEGGQ